MIHEGMMVEVVHGPLRGVVGRLMRKDSPRARLVLSVDLIGQAVSRRSRCRGRESVLMLASGQLVIWLCGQFEPKQIKKQLTS